MQPWTMAPKPSPPNACEKDALFLHQRIKFSTQDKWLVLLQIGKLRHAGDLAESHNATSNRHHPRG